MHHTSLAHGPCTTRAHEPGPWPMHHTRARAAPAQPLTSCVQHAREQASPRAVPTATSCSCARSRPRRPRRADGTGATAQITASGGGGRRGSAPRAHRLQITIACRRWSWAIGCERTESERPWPRTVRRVRCAPSPACNCNCNSCATANALRLPPVCSYGPQNPKMQKPRRRRASRKWRAKTRPTSSQAAPIPYGTV